MAALEANTIINTLELKPKAHTQRAIAGHNNSLLQPLPSLYIHLTELYQRPVHSTIINPNDGSMSSKVHQLLPSQMLT